MLEPWGRGHDSGAARSSTLGPLHWKDAVTDTATHSDARTIDGATRIATWSFVVALAVVGAAAAYVLWRDRGWLSSSDVAFFELELMRIPDEWPLVGAYSRYGWSHPGPLQYLLMWVPWRLLGGASVGLLFGMLLLHMSALIIVWFAARFRSHAAAVLVVGALLLVWAVNTDSEAVLPWNPLVGLLFGGTALILAWNASIRGRLGALLLFPIGSLLVQAHVSSAPVVLALCLAAGLLTVSSVGDCDPIPWRWWLAGAVIAGIVWIPPLIDQFGGTGNLGQILSAAAAGGPSLGLRQAATLMVDAFSVPPYWWKPTLGVVPSEFAPPWLLIPVLLALAVAMVKRDSAHLRFFILVGTALAVAGLSVSRFLDPFTYLGAWLPGIVMVVVAMSLWILVAAAGAERLALLASPLILLLPSAGVAISLVTNPPPKAQITTLTKTGTAAIKAEGLGDTGVHLSAASFEVLPALMVELQREGIPVSAATPGEWPVHLQSLVQSDPGTRTPIEVREVWEPDIQVPEGWRVIAEDDPFTAEEWRQIPELRRAALNSDLTAYERARSFWTLAALLDDRYAWQILARVD